MYIALVRSSVLFVPAEAVKLLEKVVKDREKILYKYNRQLGAAYNMLARALAMQGQTACSH